MMRLVAFKCCWWCFCRCLTASHARTSLLMSARRHSRMRSHAYTHACDCLLLCSKLCCCEEMYAVVVSYCAVAVCALVVLFVCLLWWCCVSLCEISCYGGLLVCSFKIVAIVCCAVVVVVVVSELWCLRGLVLWLLFCCSFCDWWCCLMIWLSISGRACGAQISCAWSFACLMFWRFCYIVDRRLWWWWNELGWPVCGPSTDVSCIFCCRRSLCRMGNGILVPELGRRWVSILFLVCFGKWGLRPIVCVKVGWFVEVTQ